MNIFIARKPKIINVQYGLFILIILTSLSANASGLDKLLQTLSTFNNQQAIHAHLVIASQTQRQDRPIKNGLINLQLLENEQGFNIHYSAETLALLEREAVALSAINNQEQIKQPTTIGLKNLKPIQLKNMLNVAPSLERYIHKLNFVNEESINYQGEPATLLSFTINLATVITDKKDQKHVNKFIGNYQIWTTPSGVPLTSITSFSGSGSYLFFFKTKRQQTTSQTYQVKNNRLIIQESQLKHQTNSTFGEYIETIHKTLKVINDK